MSNDIFAVLKASNDSNSYLPKIVDIYRDLNIPPDQKTAQRSVSHVFRCVCAQPEWKIPDPDDNAQAIREQVIDKVEFRYNLMDSYAEDFFRDHPEYDRDALTMAVICDDFLDRDFNTLDETESETLSRSYQIWTYAAELEEYGLEDHDVPDRTAWFLACINAMEQLNNFRLNLDDFPVNELETAKHSFFHIAGSLIDPNTQIGTEMHKHLDELDEIIQHKRPPAPVISLAGRSLRPGA